MNYFKYLILAIFIIFLNGCATNNQKNIKQISNAQISELLDELHKKELEIVRLEKELEEYKKRFN
ncbi:hypothetical protein [Malaciobacter mytili]|uniref:Lipoprotein n=1 Tax=Malaciobacter mytili LMG 24559 TaxID=1032238 RepID=A0AAX2AKZ6_9BACT|nr:hypothetical protein [Malaciobacter mytili]AXH13737.1 hypothetical protein AMYT_0111 [Malaciobacter mytili LMG 24559]RXI42642.1 hypothetical protein CRU99_08970 [Malaciobacter mytili]RXK16346.1 hypothetical protein CP985_04100 [Malaciobacter mytili LMG 24559]